MPSVNISTPAKINLGLEILRIRADGYHEINSLFLPVPLFDELSFEPTGDGIEFATDTHTLPSDESNLCLRAVSALRKQYGIADRGVRIVLHKHIPVGAGLGGGSSDAACTLTLLNRMWGINVSATELHGIARSIGADVPFFLAAQPSIVRGIGDEITPIEFPLTLNILLVCPPIHINTGWAYRQVSCDPPRPESEYARVIPTLRDISDLDHHFRNDFEPFVFPHHPQLAEIKSQLLRSGAAYAAMSGSGSTMYGVYPTLESATRASAGFQGMTCHVVAA